MIMRFLANVRALYAAVAILFATLMLGAYVEIRNEEMHAQQLQITVGLERMVRFNKELSAMLSLAALKNSALALASYDTVRADLTLSMDTVAAESAGRPFAGSVESLKLSQEQLREIERRIIELINGDRFEEASALLFGDEYVLAYKTYEVDSETAVGEVDSDLAAVSRRFDHLRTGALVLRIGALLLLICIGAMFSRRMAASLDEETKLHREISQSYQEVEAKVRERTAELEQTAHALASENEERQKADQRVRLILDSAGEGIFGLDQNGCVVFVNLAASELLGFSAEELAGRPIHSLILHSHADGTPQPQAESAIHLAGESGQARHVTNEVMWRKDGASFACEYTVTPIVAEDGAVSGVVVVFRDVTEARRTQHELQQRMDELERFNRLTIGREERMIVLKQEINELLASQGLPRRYKDLDAES